jgi:hypothetical protein
MKPFVTENVTKRKALVKNQGFHLLGNEVLVNHIEQKIN